MSYLREAFLSRWNRADFSQIWRALALLILVLILGSCSSDGGPPDVVLTTIDLSPAAITLQVGGAQQFTATGHFSDGSTGPVSVTWAATGGTISSAGLYTGGSTAGSFQVVATQAGGTINRAAEVTLTAAPPVLTSITVTPSPVSLIPGATQQFVATGHYTGGGTGAVTVVWTATGGTITAGGLYTAGATTGPFQVTATNGSIAGSSTVTITPAPPTLSSITVAPATVTLAPGGTQTFTATAHYSDGSSGSVPVNWTATGGTVTAGGLYTAGTTDGAYQVTATAQGSAIAGHADATIVTPPPSLVSIEVSPSGARLKWADPQTGTAQYTAVGHLSDGSTTPVPVNWSTTVTAGGNPHNSISATGLFTAGYPIGPFTVTATLQGGSLAGTATGNVHSTTGATVQGPLFWAPVAGSVYLCTSNHFTDDGDGIGGVATITAAEGVVGPNVQSYTNIGAPLVFGDGSGAVKVVCTEVWHAPSGMTGTAQVTIGVTSNRPGSAMAKIFVYSNPCLTSDCRAGYTALQDFQPPNWNTGPVSQTVTVSATTGANIWFKSTYVP